jgi:hypothetical protein
MESASCHSQNKEMLPMISWKGKGKLPVLYSAPCHEDVLGSWRYSSTHSLMSVVDGGEWSGTCPSCFTPRERAPSTHWIGGWMGSRAGLDMVSEKNSQPLPGIEPLSSDYPACSQSLYQLLLWYHGGNKIWKHCICHVIFPAKKTC